MNEFPKVIELQMHNYCNASCIICPYREINEKKMHMEEWLFDKILDEIGERQILMIPYLNNEPFLDDNFCQKLEKINRKVPNCLVEVSTNMSCVCKDVQEKMKNLRIDDFRMSVFGYYKETYEKMMPGLHYEKTWDNINSFLYSEIRKNIPLISITMIEHSFVRDNEYAMMGRFAEENNIVFNHWGFLDRAGNNSYYRNQIEFGKIIGCEQNRQRDRIHILCDGTVVLCCQDWRKEVILGSVIDSTIEEIWNGQLYREMREKIEGIRSESIEICERCKLAIRR